MHDARPRPEQLNHIGHNRIEVKQNNEVIQAKNCKTKDAIKWVLYGNQIIKEKTKKKERIM